MKVDFDYLLMFQDPFRIQKYPLYTFETRQRKKHNCSRYNIFMKHMFFYSQVIENRVIHGDASRVSILSNEAEDKEEEITIKVVAQKWSNYNKCLK